MPSLLVLSFVEWHGAFQRPQHLAVGFARRGWDVTHVSPGYLHRRAGRVSSGIPIPRRLRVLEPPALPGARRSSVVARVNECVMEGAIRLLGRPRSASSSADEFDVVLFNDPRQARVAAAIPARLRVHDAMDDLSALFPDPATAALWESRALAAADRIVTGTGAMADRLSGMGLSARFIPCGVEGGRFASPDPDEVAARRAELASLFPADLADRPLAGYFGALNERIDPGAVAGLLDAGWRVLLIGPAASTLPALPESPALARTGPRPYASLPAWLATMDLAVIPYRTDGPNRFLYPVKALEYLAGGRPVLSTPLPDVERFLGEFLEIARGAEDWLRFGREWRDAASGPALRARLAEATARGRAMALARSWDAMADEFEEEFRAGLGARSGSSGA